MGGFVPSTSTYRRCATFHQLAKHYFVATNMHCHLRLILINFLLLANLDEANAQKASESAQGKLHISGTGGLVFRSGDIDLYDHFSTGFGFGGGVIFNQRLLVAIRFLAVRSDAEQSFIQDNMPIHAQFAFSENAIGIQYGVSTRRTIQPFVGSQLGYGTAKWELSANLPHTYDQPPPVTDNVLVISPSIGAHLNVSRWFRPDLVVGYRLVHGLDMEATSSTDLNGFFFELNLMFGGFGIKASN